MLFFKLFPSGSVTAVLEKYEDNAISRHDFKCWKDAERVAEQANLLNDGHGYIATDAGPHVSPRYDVIRMPQVGDEVSMGFNGDYYPCGTIVRVSGGEHRIVTTSDGKKFYRRKRSGAWRYNQTWYLVAGHINERNPHF